MNKKHIMITSDRHPVVKDMYTITTFPGEALAKPDVHLPGRAHAVHLRGGHYFLLRYQDGRRERDHQLQRRYTTKSLMYLL